MIFEQNICTFFLPTLPCFLLSTIATDQVRVNWFQFIGFHYYSENNNWMIFHC
uniref:Uncharacterized protein n=1 Tax=Arundo donax TaxID=35708 RepID=A0A0A8Y2T5_ARUDO